MITDEVASKMNHLDEPIVAQSYISAQMESISNKLYRLDELIVMIRGKCNDILVDDSTVVDSAATPADLLPKGSLLARSLSEFSNRLDISNDILNRLYYSLDL